MQAGEERRKRVMINQRPIFFIGSIITFNPQSQPSLKVKEELWYSFK
jgi:hypothetical protein